MKLPRDLTGDEFVKLLTKLGYKELHQTGSHIRLSTEENGTHKVTVPKHKVLQTGTLSGIILDISKHLGKSKKEIILDLFYDGES